MLADKAGRDYSTPWDAMKSVGCLCDPGFRGPACELQVKLGLRGLEVFYNLFVGIASSYF